ncbi:MAG: dihydroneopterin aldolase [Spirochaetes bacterium]|nr:dihydroneopterin aldolase [Spirochaetota bacterium]
MINSNINYDKIYIKDLSLHCIIGINKNERKIKQEIIVNIILYADLKSACQSDCIKDTVDYEIIKNNIVSIVEKFSFFLVEKLAEKIAQACLENSQVIRVDVTIDKPKALRSSRSVAVEIFRTKKDLE